VKANYANQMTQINQKWQDHFSRCKQVLKAIQAGKHFPDIEITTLKAHFCDKIPPKSL
jgi:hypothetical protein